MLPRSRAPLAPPPVVHHVEGQLTGDTSTNGLAPIDKYTAGIELSNACRQFYVSRVKASAKVKERLGITDNQRSSPTSGRGAGRPGAAAARPRSSSSAAARSHPTLNNTGVSQPQAGTSSSSSVSSSTTPNTTVNINTKPNTSIDSAMHVLKREMSSLIDQDLALMGQLLTLNEQIEELKWRYKLRGYFQGSLQSSCNLDVSSYSMCTSSEACTAASSLMDVVPEFVPKYPSPSELSLYDNGNDETSPRASQEADLPGLSHHHQRAPASCVNKPEVTSRGKPEVLTMTSTSDLGSAGDLGSLERPQRPSGWSSQSTAGPVSGPGAGPGAGPGERPRQEGAAAARGMTGRVLPHHSRSSQDQQSFDSGIYDPEPGHLVEIML